jgi:electron transport complex protein RnfC
MDGFWPTFTRRAPRPPRLIERLFRKPTGAFRNPRTAVVLLQDDPQAPFQCLVKPREEVTTGQKIGEKGSPPFAVSVHASITGKIREVDSFPSPHGFYVTGVLIEAGDHEEPCQKISAPRGPEATLETLLQAGIPLDYGFLAGGQVDCLLVNGTEFEPSLGVQNHLLEEKAPQVVKGLEALMAISKVPRAVICVEQKQRKSIQALEKAIAGSRGITLMPTGKSYPPTAESVLAAIVLKKGKSAAAGKIFSVDLAFLPAIEEAVDGGMPFIERVVTVAGSAIPNPRNLNVRIGTPFDEIIVQCGGNLETVTQIIMGGPLMGISQVSAQVPVSPRTAGILALVALSLTSRQSHMYEEGPCVRCAKCVDACPVDILPTTIAAYCRKRRFEESEEMGLFVCIDCGLCSYVCPARIPLAQILREAKSRKALRLQANLPSGNQ